MDPDLHFAGEQFAVTIAASLADYQRRAAPPYIPMRALVVPTPGWAVK